MAVINIDDAYILDETGAQVDKVTGLFTKDENTDAGEKAFAQLNIGTAGSNRNLLDNPWFTVNQRGKSSYNYAGYSVDRWLSNSTQQVTVSSDGVTLGEQGYRFVQRMENPAIFAGKTLTISVKTSAANVRFAYWDSTSDYSNGTAITVPVVNGYASLTINITNGIYAIGLSTASGTGGLYRAMKLELGSVSTLANDTPPKYEQALLDCEYRCVVYDLPTKTLLCRGIATSTTNIAGVIDLPRDMAEDKTPTVSITGSLTTPAGNTITAVSAATYARKNKLRVNFTGTGFKGGTVYDIFTGTSTPKITISADL